MKCSNLYNCVSCNKIYKSYMGFWKHNNKYHKSHDVIEPLKMSTNVNFCQPMSTNVNQCQPNNNQILTKCITNTTSNKIDVLECKFCNKKFNIRQSRWKHEQKCKIKNNENIIIENNKLKHEIELLKNNNNTIINNTINNNVINNNTINIVKFGSENLSDILTDKEMFRITKFVNSAVNESIKTVHFNNNRPEFKNIRIKNLKDKYLEVFNGLKFVTDNKYNNLYELIDNHIYNIQTFITNNKDKFNNSQLINIEKFLKLIENNTKCIVNNIKYNSYYDYKVDDINTLIYNLSKN